MADFLRSCSTPRPGRTTKAHGALVSTFSSARQGQSNWVRRRAFQVDASWIARLPLTTDYFPELAANTIPVRGRDPEIATRVEERLRKLVAAGFEITRVDAIGRRQK
jgi:hypothetical protein